MEDSIQDRFEDNFQGDLGVELLEQVDESYSGEITEPFDPSKIDIKEQTMTIDLISKRIKASEINLNTEFQRSSGLWDDVQQSRLIESLMIRIPLPAFYFDGTDDSNWLIVDGLQRLSSLKKFVIDESLSLTNLEYLTQYNGHTFSELPRAMQRRIEETQVIAFIINPGTPPQVKFNIFKRINTGGLSLSPQEIRHAVNQGIPSKFVATLATNESFLKATCNVVKTERMEDRDFVLRFLAFSIIYYKDYFPDLDNFMNQAMKKIGELSDSQRNVLSERFVRAMTAAHDIFGNDAFRKRYHKKDARKPVNKALFEAWGVCLGALPEESLIKLVDRKELLKDLFISLMVEDREFESSISEGTGDVRRVHYRFSMIEKLIDKVINIDY